MAGFRFWLGVLAWGSGLDSSAATRELESWRGSHVAQSVYYEADTLQNNKQIQEPRYE